MKNDEIRILIPWTTSMYKYFNGVHPFSRSWLDNNSFPGIRFQFPNAQKFSFSRQVQLLLETTKRYLQILNSVPSTSFSEDWILQHIRMQSLPNQMLIESYANQVDLVFHHTVPLNCNSSSWILHFESPTTLFYPFVNHGESDYLDFESLEIYHLVKAQLKSANCKGVFSHIYENTEIIKRIFNDDEITRKIKYIPAGIQFPTHFEEAIQRKINSSLKDRPIRFLFTNSFQGNPEGFFLRGGLDVLHTIGRLAETYSNIELTILSHIPITNPPTERFGILPQDFTKSIPPSLDGKIKWVASGVSDEKLDQLFVECDFFLLPSAGLHSMSALKALAHGCCTLVSDVPGFSEYITDQENGFIIKGRLAQVYSVEPKTGWFRDHYESMFSLNSEVCDNLYRTLSLLISDDQLRSRSMRNALERIKNHQRIDRWCDNFSEFVYSQMNRTDFSTAVKIPSRPNWNPTQLKFILFREYGIRMDIILYFLNLKNNFSKRNFSYLYDNFLFRKIVERGPQKVIRMIKKIFLGSKKVPELS